METLTPHPTVLFADLVQDYTGITAFHTRERFSTIALETDPQPDYYAILGIARSASPAAIKAAYRHTLLCFHPDKRSEKVSLRTANQSNSSHRDIDMGSIKDAFLTLSTPALREEYDRELEEHKGPRPAQIISLEEFDEGDGVWSHACRCGGVYRISEAELDKGQHLVGCGSCSEVVWAGYEAIYDDGGQ